MIGHLVDGHYFIQAQIGKGGMGLVYQAFDRYQRHLVALKILHPCLDSPELAARFALEYTVLTQLNHPNIVQALGRGCHRGLPYLALELLPGRTLQQAMADGPLPRTVALVVARQIAEVLIYLHQQGIVHRDLKPSNIILSCEGSALQLKLLDFGLVQTADTGRSLDQKQSTLGTIAYLSPEQAQGLAVDYRTDLYALGAIMYEMATGRPPFVNESLAQILIQQLTERPVPPHQLNPCVDEAWSDLILHLLEKEPAKRPLHTKWVAAQLAQLETATLGIAINWDRHYAAAVSASSTSGTPAWID